MTVNLTPMQAGLIRGLLKKRYFELMPTEERGRTPIVTAELDALQNAINVLQFAPEKPKENE
jgi:hypothetical protein